MTINRERERFNDLILLFNNQSFSMSKDSSSNILSLKFSPDEIGRTIDLNSSLRVNFSDEGDFALCNREIKVSVRVNVFIKAKTLWQMNKGFPEVVFKHSRESCAMFFLSKTSVRFLIMIILQESFAGFSKDSKGRAVMSMKRSFLPEGIKTLNRGIPAGFSLWDKYQMYSHEQVQANNLRNDIRITPSTCSSHLIIHLGYCGNAHKSPCSEQMFAERDGLFISKLTCKGCMSCHIHSMERIESGNTFAASEVPWSNKVCLMEVSHLFCPNVRIRLIIAISFRLNFACLSITRKYPCNSRDGRNITNLSLLKLPVNNLCSNSRELGTPGFMRFKFFSDRENLFNQIIRDLSPDSFWNAALIFETFKPMLSKSFKPFGEPSLAPLEQLKCFIETMFFVKLYRFAAFFILILIFHRLSLLLKVFRRSLDDVKTSSRCYDIF